MKRKRPDIDDDEPFRHRKRPRPPSCCLLGFTDEILLRTLSFLNVHELNILQRVSKRFWRLSCDAALWKANYYTRWIEPRKPHGSQYGLYSTRHSRTHRHPHGFMATAGLSVDWKRLYKIRNNWWRGRCRIQELEITGGLSTPHVLCNLYKGIIVTVDSRFGLRSWSRKTGIQPLRSRPIDRSLRDVAPTAIDVSADGLGRLLIAVGYADGSFDLSCYCDSSGFTSLHNHASDTSGPVSAIAIIHGYVALLVDGRFVSLYELVENDIEQKSLRCTRLAFLQAEDSRKIVSLSLRRNGGRLTASVVYPVLRLGLGWCIGLQEMRISAHRSETDKRIENSEPEHQDGLQESISTRIAWSAPINLHQKLRQCPTSLSYSHPYLVATLSDNTLVAYLVKSNAEVLDVGVGRRLWGHTSAVSGVKVDSRGKTVTVSGKGNDGQDVRVWELEGLGTGLRESTCILPAQVPNELAAATERCGRELSAPLGSGQARGINASGWIGFDDEHVAILGRCTCRQVLSCYDFDMT